VNVEMVDMQIVFWDKCNEAFVFAPYRVWRHLVSINHIKIGDVYEFEFKGFKLGLRGEKND
jgi:hypothetical protein